MSNKWNTIIGQIEKVFAREKKDNRIKQKLKIKHQSFIHIFLIVVKLILLEAKNGGNSEVIASQIITLKIKGIGNNNILGHPDNFKVEYYPKYILINGIEQNNITYSYLFNETDNVIILKWETEIKNCSNMFYGCNNITEINLIDFDSSQIRNMKGMFYDCSSLVSLLTSTNFNTLGLTNTANMFYGCSSLISLDLSKFGTSSVTNMNRMFYGCISLISLDLANFNTSKVRNMGRMFQGCSSLNTLNLINFDTSSVMNMQLMFYGCSNLSSLNLENFKTPQVEDMARMFEHCSSLNILNLINFDTSNVTNMDHMFYDCSNLSILYLSNFDTSKVENMTSMFSSCLNLISLDLSNFNTSNVVDMHYMFYNCSSLNLLKLTNFDTSHVTDMGYMFYNCSSLNSLDLTNFCTSQVINMMGIFSGCSSLESLNLSNFDISKVEKIDKIFQGCENLEFINIFNFKENNLTEYNNMFDKVPDNVVICFNENDIQEKIFPQIENKTCYSLYCSNDWKLHQNQINIQTGECIVNCNINSDYKYEYNGKCYNRCEQGFIEFYNDFNNKYICKCELGQCLDCSQESLELDLCTKCYNNYYPIENGNLNYGGYINCYKELEGYYLDKNDSLFKKCYYRCKECNIKGDNITHNCLQCNDDFPIEINVNDYINCYSNISYDDYFPYSQYNYFYSDITNSIEYTEYNEIKNKFTNIENFTQKINLMNSYSQLIQDSNKITNNLIDNINFTQLIISKTSYSNEIDDCFLGDKLNNICDFLNISNNIELFKIIKDNIALLYSHFNGKSQVIQGRDNIIFQITNEKNELELLEGESLNNQNVSILDLNQCENTLKKHYHLDESDSLVILKKENTTTKSLEKNVEYVVFEPYNFTELNLSICEGNKINLYVKIELSEETKIIYENMKAKGFDMFDINDPFYQDICTPYKYANNTDITLPDRKNYIYNNKDTQCQSNCQFSSYLHNSLYINCTCDVVNQNTDNTKVDEKFSTKKLYESFYDVLKYSNFKIIKCYNLLLSINVISKNFGSIIILVNFSIYFICLIVFMVKGIFPLTNKIKVMLSKYQEKNEKNNDINIHIIKRKSKVNNNKIIKNKLNSPPIKKKILSNLNQKIKRNSLKQENTIGKKLFKFKSIKPIFLKKSMSKNIPDSSKDKLAKINKKFNTVKVGSLFDKKIKDKQKLDAFELNDLEYNEAVVQDKRNFIQIYFDLLCREHLIIFTFFICNDYNLLYIKYARFIFLVSTDMAMNVFFFSDDSMHKIFLNYGKYNFIQQIPQIVYTTIISQLMEIFLCYLSLTDKHVYAIKNSNQTLKGKKTQNILKCIKYKLVSFFIFTFIIFGCYWYIVAVFCAVYENTQIIFLKDCLSSFGLGLLYPFVIYLIPSLFRIISIRFPKQELRCMYKLSDIIPFF